MELKTAYKEIHEKAYLELKLNKRKSWSSADDIEERIQFYKKAIEDNNTSKGSSVLVLGCGDGETSLALTGLGYLVNGVDISPTAIKWAKQKAINLNLGTEFNELNIVKEQFPKKTFDVIIDDHCLHCIIPGDRKGVFKKTHNSLSENGVFLMRTHCGNPPENLSIEISNTWAPKTRCQVYNGVAGRYFGSSEQIITEIKNVGLKIKHKRVFQFEDNWPMLEVIAGL